MARRRLPMLAEDGPYRNAPLLAGLSLAGLAFAAFLMFGAAPRMPALPDFSASQQSASTQSAPIKAAPPAAPDPQTELEDARANFEAVMERVQRDMLFGDGAANEALAREVMAARARVEAAERAIGVPANSESLLLCGAKPC